MRVRGEVEHIMTIVFNFTTLFQLCQLFITTRLHIVVALYKTHTHIFVLNICDPP